LHTNKITLEIVFTVLLCYKTKFINIQIQQLGNIYHIFGNLNILKQENIFKSHMLLILFTIRLKV